MQSAKGIVMGGEAFQVCVCLWSVVEFHYGSYYTTSRSLTPYGKNKSDSKPRAFIKACAIVGEDDCAENGVDLAQVNKMLSHFSSFEKRLEFYRFL